MKTTKLLRILIDWRNYLLVALMAVGLFTLCGMPEEVEPHWFEKFFISKIIAAACFGAIYALYLRWKSNLPELLK